MIACRGIPRRLASKSSDSSIHSGKEIFIRFRFLEDRLAPSRSNGVFTENELSEESVVNYWLTTTADGELQRVATAEESSVVQTEGGARPPLFLDYEQRRRTEEAQAADAQDEAELKALENRIKDRKEVMKST
jgi:hypothetical protein